MVAKRQVGRGNRGKPVGVNPLRESHEWGSYIVKKSKVAGGVVVVVVLFSCGLKRTATSLRAYQEQENMTQTGTLRVVHCITLKNPVRGMQTGRQVTLFTDYNVDQDYARRVAQEWKNANPEMDLHITFTVVDYL